MARRTLKDFYGPRVAQRVAEGWKFEPYRRINLTPLTPTIGAEVGDVDLALPLEAEVIDEVRQALAEWKVLFFREQRITRERQVEFAAVFGPVEGHPFARLTGVYGKAQPDDAPEVFRFVKDERSPGVENFWHNDLSFQPCPSMATVLRAVEVPPVGGDTLWCDMAAAFENLPEDLKERVSNLSAEHDWFDNFGNTMSEEARNQLRPHHPPVIHPVAPRHPVTGRRCLFVNRIFTKRIIDVGAQESKELLETLFEQPNYCEYQCRFRWRPDSIALWDNRASQHYAVSDYAPQRRVMERVSVQGPRPA
ncbi:MAG: TauD/TfdA family dioxygenase [Gammaproteobacteria bacterium]|nr:TauD/TfdA family dioxygenase [Gammaproteobacteria bacterium]